MHKRTHTRCKGTGGFELVNGNIVPCAGCCGRGYLIIYTAAEKAARKAAWEQRCKAQQMIKQHAAKMSEGMTGMLAVTFAEIARQGFGRLADREPERLSKLYASLAAGRLDDVVNALYHYKISTDA